MKKTLSTLVILGLIATAFVAAPAEAKKKRRPAPKKVERVVEFEYACPCAGLFQLGGLSGGDPNLGGGPMPVGGTERYLNAVAEDQSGQAVAINIQQDLDGDGGNNPVAQICTTTDGKAVPINPGLEIRVFIGGQCADGTPTAPIGGNITFTLSNMP